MINPIHIWNEFKDRSIEFNLKNGENTLEKQINRISWTFEIITKGPNIHIKCHKDRGEDRRMKIYVNKYLHPSGEELPRLRSGAAAGRTL